MRINSVPDVKCFFNNKNVLRAQSMVLLFVRHPAIFLYVRTSYPNRCECVRSFQYSITTLLADTAAVLQDRPHASDGW